MPSSTLSFSFDVESDPACWNGTPTYIEMKILRQLPHYAIEQLRTRFLHAITTNHDLRKGARALAQMAYETEIGAAIFKVVPVPAEIPMSNVCERRRYLDIDVDMKKYFFLLGPALQDLRDEGILPDSYVRLFETHLASPYARYRVCAMAALLLISTQLLISDQVNAIVITKHDTVSAVDTAAALIQHVVEKADAVSTADAAALVRESFYSESVAAADDVIVAIVEGKLESDTVNTTDAVTLEISRGYAVDKADTVTADDGVVLERAHFESDTATAIDDFTVEAHHELTFDDTVTTDDSASLS